MPTEGPAVRAGALIEEHAERAAVLIEGPTVRAAVLIEGPAVAGPACRGARGAAIMLIE